MAPDVPRPLAEEAVRRDRDRSATPALLRRVVADRLRIVPDEMAAGHCVTLGRPKELVDLLESDV